MKIGIGVGIGRHQFKLGNAPSGWQLPYAWASLYAPTVTTTQVQNANVTSVPASVTVSANAPVISTASAINQSVSSIVATSTASTGTPTVSTTKSPIVTPTVASAQATTGIPTVNAGSVVNQSVSSVVASATTSAGTPTVSGGSGTTTYYLQMDGVDDYVKTPSINIDSISIDCLVVNDASQPSLASNPFLLDARQNGGKYFKYNNTSGYATSTGITSVNGLTKDTRMTITFNFPAITSIVYFFASDAGTIPLKGNIYKITCSLGGVTKALYDMSTGNVNDQTGNGYNATNNDGTWVSQ